MKQHGFSLPELMAVVLIIGILMAIAVPSYQNYVKRGLQTQAMTEMLDILRAQENLFANNFSYTNDLTEVNFSNAQATTNEAYIITAEACAGFDLTQCIQLRATPINTQINFGILTLDSRGNRTHKGLNGWPK